jgi:hypothetical protein
VIPVKPDDRVLLLAAPQAAAVRQLAGELLRGVAVCVAGEDEVYALRRELQDCANVMVAPADPTGTIPWRDEFFSVVFAPHLSEPPSEILRVAAPGATIHLAGGPLTRR